VEVGFAFNDHHASAPRNTESMPPSAVRGLIQGCEAVFPISRVFQQNTAEAPQNNYACRETSSRPARRMVSVATSKAM
jgi:hypothetical protein